MLIIKILKIGKYVSIGLTNPIWCNLRINTQRPDAFSFSRQFSCLARSYMQGESDLSVVVHRALRIQTQRERGGRETIKVDKKTKRWKQLDLRGRKQIQAMSFQLCLCTALPRRLNSDLKISSATPWIVFEVCNYLARRITPVLFRVRSFVLNTIGV